MRYLGKLVAFETPEKLEGVGFVVAEQVVKRLKPLTRTEYSRLSLEERRGVKSFTYDQHTLIVNVDGYEHRVPTDWVLGDWDVHDLY